MLGRWDVWGFGGWNVFLSQSTQGAQSFFSMGLGVWKLECFPLAESAESAEFFLYGFAPRYIPHAGHSEHSGTSLGELDQGP